MITIGYPGHVVHGNIASDPRNLGARWVGFDFKNAFEHPVKIINDVSMQNEDGSFPQNSWINGTVYWDTFFWKDDARWEGRNFPVEVGLETSS